MSSITTPTVRLIDERSEVVHTWSNTHPVGIGSYLDADGNLLRIYQAGGIERLAFDGTVLWNWQYDRPGAIAHHDIEVLPNGNILVIAYQQKTAAEAIAAGRDPSLINDPFHYPEQIIEVRQTGPTTADIVWEWNLWDHMIQDFDPTKDNYGVVGDHPELVDVNYPLVAPRNGDWIHMNSVDYDPVHDWIVLGARNAGELWIIDHSTTTAQAAGHTGGRRGRGGDLLYRWGNPQAYRAGTAADRVLDGAHAPNTIPVGYPGAGNILMFNNRTTHPSRTSTIVEIQLPLDPLGNFILDPSGRYGPSTPIWTYEDPNLFSPIVSSAERLPDGNTLICSGVQNRVFEVTSSGALAWEHIVPFETLFHAHYYPTSMWCDSKEISVATGGTATLDLVAGSARRDDIYLVLGSASGTNIGVWLGSATLPLNFDGYFMSTLQNPNVYPWIGTQGTLDNLGNGQAQITFPGGILPPELAGLRLDHAYLTLDASSGALSWVSNPTGFRFSM